MCIKMSQFKKLALAIISVVGLSTLCYAAVTPITESELGVQGVRMMRAATPTPTAVGDECVNGDSCPAGIEDGGQYCDLRNSTNTECKTVNCCHNDGYNVSYKICPDDFDKPSTSEVNVKKKDELEYCIGFGYNADGTLNTESKFYYRQDFEDCVYHDITNETYINALASASDQTPIGTEGQCKYEETSYTYGTVDQGSYSLCPSDASKWAIDETLLDCGDGATVFTCAVKCGEDTYCGAKTCDASSLPLCSEAAEYDAYKEAIGDLRYAGYTSEQADIFKYPCKATESATEVSYAGFKCSESKYNATEDVCTTNGFTTSDVGYCEITDPDTGATTETWYECNCNDTSTWFTLSEYCTKKGITTTDECNYKYMVKNSATGCTLFEGGNETNKRYKEEALFDKDQLCERNDTLKQSRWAYIPSGSTPGNGVPYVQGCYVLNENGDPQEIGYAFYNCRGYKTKEEQDKECKKQNGDNSEALLCDFPFPDNAIKGDSLNDDVYLGCSCEDSFKTIDEMCNGDADCEKYAMPVQDEICYPLVKKINVTPNDYYNRIPEDGPLSIRKYNKWKCSNDYITKEEWCNENSATIPLGFTCDNYQPSGTIVCEIEEDKKKYLKSSFELRCPTDDSWTIKDAENECKLDENSEPSAKACKDADGNTKYICTCPEEYGTECEDSYKSRGGQVCKFDKDISGASLTKYKSCYVTCGHEYASSYSKTVYGCDGIDIYSSSVRIDSETGKPEQCVQPSNRELNYICGCPSNFQEVKPWCDENYENEGLEIPSQCYYNYMGSGTRCRRDISVVDGKVSVLTKYAYYIRNCPTDRPLYYSEEDCQVVKGEFESKCRDENGNERVICQCPIDWYDAQGNNKNSGACEKVGNYNTEASGEYCDFDGEENFKYQECIVKCNDALNDNSIVLSNAYTYLDAGSKTPTQTMCTQQMGNGAVMGVAGYAYCSLNHTIMYPCYCPASFRECLAEDNEIAAEGAQVCKVNGKTYYSDCKPVACQEETSTRAVVPADTDVETVFGEGAEKKACVSESGDHMWEVTCDASAYPDPCDYPYEEPSTGKWCKYGDGSTLMESGRKHYKAGACKIRKTLGSCGTEIAGNSNPNLVISVASTESECKARFGNAISTQLCEYGKEQGYKRAYNCYYDSSDFIWTTRNCGVRHNLTGEYLIINGVKHWNQCRCASAYQHHKFNCGGLLSGSPCQQQIDAALLTEDSSLNEAEQGNFIDVNDTLPFYPYCECSADYTEICDEDGTGRYKGVGEACNGKYKACECVPDPLPDNWTDNYYGCAGGKKPTGVWKDNGCGKKYWQCTVNECTWEYTEMCEAPLIPVGESCQDNQGNIGGYKACTCPSDYKTCPVGQVGEGEPCNLKGVSYYKSCKSQDACNSLANETCTGPLQIGVNPCTRDTVTYYESCVCANGYDKVCGEGEVGVGNYCELDGVKYYKECAKPENNQCTAGHVTACDTNQESYSPCVGTDENGKQIVKYLCKCPSNWKACSGGSGESCTQKSSDGSEKTYYQECNSGADTCSEYQELTYKVCTAAQTGDGGSCTSTISSTGADGLEIETSVVKYAECKDSNNCVANGFRYSCSGYDVSALGESCVDANGNKLYKECPCPSSYVSCNNGNATKGNKCNPLKADGSFGDTVYSSCECDKSRYKYTCKTDEESDPYNKGIKVPDSNNFCEITEIQKIYDAEGNVKRDEVTGQILTEEVKVKYFSYCECKDAYKYTCSDSDHGEVLPTGYEEDYCKINGTKFYKGCDCDDEKYTVEAEACSEKTGQQVDLTLGSCTIRGKVPNYTEDENGALVENGTKKNTTKYKGCQCKSNFSLECNEKDAAGNYIYEEPQNSDTAYCETDDGKKFYPQCTCSTKKDCSVSGLNTGITGGTQCENRVANGNGGYSKSYVYDKCVCKTNAEGGAYDVVASKCSGENFDMSSAEYCYTGEVGEEKKYQKCICDSSIFETTPYSSKDAEDYCNEQGMAVNNKVEVQFCEAATDASGYEYYPNKSLCYSSGINESEWTIFPETNSYYDTQQDFIAEYGSSNIEDDIERLCGYKYNAKFTLDKQGLVYYKCVNNTVKTGDWWTQSECTSENADWKAQGSSKKITDGWKGTYTVYNKCDCSSDYSSTDDTCSKYSCKKRTNTSIASCKPTESVISCTDIDPNAIIKRNSKNECKARDGKIKYYSNNCYCNPAIFDKNYGACNQYSYTHEDYKCTYFNNGVETKKYRIAVDKNNQTNQTNGSCETSCEAPNDETKW